jgi:hypothetical protein
VKLFIVGPGGDNDDGEGLYSLLVETGEHLADHYCSNSSFARSDLEGRREDRQKEFKEKFGDYEVLFLNEQTEISREELIKRNQEFYMNRK